MISRAKAQRRKALPRCQEILCGFAPLREIQIFEEPTKNLNN